MVLSRSVLLLEQTLASSCTILKSSWESALSLNERMKSKSMLFSSNVENFD